LIKSIKSPGGFSLVIPDKLNICHRLREKDDSIKNEVASAPCGAYAVVFCKGDNPCSYSIQSTHKSAINQLVERKPHYQLISYNETDFYRIQISDINTKNITIVLNSHSGDADLYVTARDNNFNSRSVNENYIPDVININKGLYIPDLRGEYMVYVKGETFASYSIYYYTHKENEDINNNLNPYKNRTSIVNLQAGKIIKGYIKEEVGKINYKIYSFNPKILAEANPLDLRISLTPEHSEYQMFITFDYKDLSFTTLGSIVNLDKYVFKAKENEIVIKKNDKNYKKDANYYLIIIPKHEYNNYNLTNSTILITNNSTNINIYNNDTEINSYNSLFYVGFTTEEIPFIIKEGIPSSITLDEDYKQQNYWFYHYNISQPIDISLNVFYGRVDIYIDLWWSEDISNSKTSIKALDTDSNYIRIAPEKIVKLLEINNVYSNNILNNSQNYTMSIIPFYILIKKSSTINASYLLSIKSETKSPEKLNHDIVRSDSLLSGETRRYFFHARKNDNGILSLNFKSGYGDLFINIYQSDEKENSQNYPDFKNYQKRGENYFKGKLINLNENILSNCAGSCKILISVVGNNLDLSEDKIEYSLSYHKSILKLNQNKPYHGEIKDGELQFFLINFGKEDKNAYISLTNMNGDVDMYLNYGHILPTFENHNWSSYSSNNEFIEFNKEDNYFTLNNLNDISGDYIIMLHGFINSTYSIYISSHPNKIISLNNDSPASCITKKKKEFCYFRYDDIYEYENLLTETINEGKENIKDIDIVINTHFYYGTGSIYAKLYDDTDYDILDDFPNDKNFDYSNENGNERNFLYVNINKNNTKFNSNSTLLISVQCQDNCFFDLTTSKQYDSTIKFLMEKKENIFFLKKSEKENLFVYRLRRNLDVLYNIKALKGNADVTIFSKVNSTNSKDEIEKFYIDSESTDTEINDIHRKLEFSKIINYESIYFRIKANTDFAFVIRITYPLDWQDINIGESETYVVDSKKKIFYGSININENYDHINLSISLNNKKLAAYCYVKYVIYDKDKMLNTKNALYSKEKINTYVIPSEEDNDYKANNINIYNLIIIKLPKLNKDNLKNKIVKALLSIEIFDQTEEQNIKDIKVKINASPQVNNITISKIPRNSFQYVNIQGFGLEGSVHIYELSRNIKSENILILETSSCRGNVDVYVSPKIIRTREDAMKFSFFSITPSSIDSSNGRIVYIFKGVNSDNLYLMIKGKKFSYDNCDSENNSNNSTNNILSKSGSNKDKDMKFCDNTEVLINYLFTSENLLRGEKDIYNPGSNINYEISSSDSVILNFNPLKNAAEKDDFFDSKKLQNINSDKIEYKFYISSSSKDYTYMDSVCYLNSMSNEKLISVDLIKNKKTNENKYSAKVSNLEIGKHYYINILGKDLQTNDIYAYKSIEIITRGNQYPPFLIGIFLPKN